VADPFSGNPFLDLDLGNGLTHRFFGELTEDEELVWHRDAKYRKIEVLQSNRWHFQFDNEMPFELTVGLKFDVPPLTYHRILRGFGSLELLIQE
jgi:hypothetical protein